MLRRRVTFRTRALLLVSAVNLAALWVDSVRAASLAPARGPALSADCLWRPRKASVRRLTVAGIRALRRLLAITADHDPQKPDLHFRLAEYYRDLAQQHEMLARGCDDQLYELRHAERKRKLSAGQRRHEKIARRWRLEAVKRYVRIAQNPAFSRYRRLNEVLYTLADMLRKGQRPARARVFFRRLIRDHPRSRYIPDAYLSLAEHYFDGKQFTSALALYQRVAKYPGSAIYGYAIYKQGWCWLNSNRPRKALEIFVRVIRLASRLKLTKKGAIVLAKEAKKDAVRAYAQIGLPRQAWRFFSRIGGSYARTMLRRLAAAYYDSGKFDGSIVVYRRLIKLAPRSSRLCSWQASVLKATISIGDKRAQVVEAKRLAAIYRLFAKRKDLPTHRRKECRERSEGLLRELATTWHRESVKTKSTASRALAQLLYEEYLRTFPRARHAYVMGYYYAELLFQQHKWAQAAQAYTRVVLRSRRIGAARREKILPDAAFAAVISWRNALSVREEIADTASQAGSRPRHTPRRLSAARRAFVEAMTRYLQLVPKSKERVKMLYRIGRVYYEHNLFDKAAAAFSEVVTGHTKHALAVYAANLLLDCLVLLGRHQALTRWVARMQQMKDLMAAAAKVPRAGCGLLRRRLRELRRRLARKDLERLEARRQYRKAAEDYARLANRQPDGPKWAELAYNAAMNFERAKLLGQAIAIRDALIRAKLDDKMDARGRSLARKALHQVAGNYHALAWYSRAAAYYERFARLFPEDERAPVALQNAIVFRLGRMEHDKARADARFFSRHYRARAAPAIFSLGVIHQRRGDHRAIIAFYRRYLRRYRRSGGIARATIALARMARAEWQLSCPLGAVRTAIGGHACVRVSRLRSRRRIRRRSGSPPRRRLRGGTLRTQCGPATKTKITVVSRDMQRVRRALGHAAAVLKAAGAPMAAARKSSAADHAGGAALLKALAEVRFIAAEQRFERFLALRFPRGRATAMSHQGRRKERRLAAYLHKKAARLQRARSAYQAVIKTKVPRWAIAAAARIGQLYQFFAAALYTAPIPTVEVPPSLTTAAARREFRITFNDAYCDRLEDTARPLEKKAIQGLEACLGQSKRLSHFDAWSRLCERELAQLAPARWPLTTEIRAAAGYLRLRPAGGTLITRLE